MKPGRAFSLLAGVALLGGIAKFNEMTPAAQAAFLNDAAATAQSWVQGFIVTYSQVTGTASAQQPRTTSAGPQAAAPLSVAGKDGEPPRRVAARGAEPELPPQQGNPLWTLPLKQLSMTRERPIFSPSRRPPPPPTPTFVAPVAVRQPVKPPEPERPTVALLGTIIGASTDDQIGVFLDSATQSVIRLRVGEDHQGWVLRLIKAREATLVKNGEEAVVLQLAAPGDAPLPGLPGVPGAMPGMPAAGLPGLPPGVMPGGVPGGGSTVGTSRRQQRR
jgi:general secretion pathway protein N